VFWNWFSNKVFDDAIGAVVKLAGSTGAGSQWDSARFAAMPVLDPLPTVV